MENQIISVELMELGNRVRKYRNERHWSQEKLAEKVDVSLNTVSRIQGGQTRMSIEIFMRLVQVLGVDAELLLFGVFPNNRDETEYARIQLMIQRLQKDEKEIVLQMMGTLAESLQMHRGNFWRCK